MYNLGQYVSGDSLVHRLDPRLKILFVVALSVVVLRANLLSCTVASAFLAVVIFISQLTFGRVIKSLRPAAIFFAFLFFIHLFLTEGTPIQPFPLWHVKITWEGLYQGALLTWRFVLLVTSASILTMTTLPSELISGIERLLRPLNFLGISSHDLAVMMSIALRFVPTLLEETKRIKEAQMARGADFETGNVFQKIRTITLLAVPLVVNSCRRVEELAAAMEGRGYQRGPRTYMQELHMTKLDFAAAGVGATVVFIIGLFCV